MLGDSNPEPPAPGALPGNDKQLLDSHKPFLANLKLLLGKEIENLFLICCSKELNVLTP